MKKELLKLYILITFFALFAVIVYFTYEQNKNIFAYINEDEVIKINYESGFYDKSIDLKLNKHIELPISAEIYYTLNGDNPTIESNRYINNIKLEISDNTNIYPFKAVVYYNGKYSNIIERTYILDKNITDRYNLNVINITSDSKNLYDYEKGILVPGKTYDDNIRNGAKGYIKGNYNNRGEEWMRDSHIIMFDNLGNKLLDENVKIGVSGGTSSGMSVKSLKITSLLENFKLNLYNIGELSSNSQVSSYNSFRLRSGSQDINFGNIKSSIISKLSSESNFDGCTTTERVVVYLNGKFYGIFDLQQNYSNSFLARKYNINDNTKIEKHKSSEKIVFSNADIKEFFENDLDIIENRNKLEKYVDMDNYLLYYAINILANNTDWPQNNFEIWRYNGIYDLNNKYTDGRYRFLIYDTDLIYYSSKNSIYFEGCDQDTFVSLLENKYRAINSTFLNVMKSEYYRNKFINIVLDLLKTSFKEENILKIVEEEFNKIKLEVSNSYNEKQYQNFINKVDIIKEEVVKRDDNLIDEMEYYFNLDKKYSFYLKTSNGLYASWNNTTIYQNQSFENDYYYNTSIKITIDNYPGYDLDYIMVNGEKYYDKEIIIDDSFVKDEKIEIETFSKKNNQTLIISEVSAKSDSDWIKITNINNQKINLSNYYISDNEKNLYKYKLPDRDLKSNESIIINGKSNYYSIGDYISNFNLREQEKLLLINNNEIVDSLVVPRMSSNETYGRYDNSNEYVFFNNYNNIRKK